MTDQPLQNVKRTMFWLSIGTITYFFSQWLLTVLVVRITDYDVAGDFSLAMSSSNIFYAVALFGMRPFQISDTRQQFSDKTYFFSRAATSGVAFLACAVFCIFNGFTWMQNLCLIVFMFYRVTEAGMDVLHGVMQSAYRTEIVGKSLIIRGIVALVLFCVTLIVSRQLLLSLIAMTVFSVSWIVFFEFNYAKKVSRNRLVSDTKIDFREIVKLLKACAPLLLGNLVYSLIFFVPRYYIESLYGTDALGVYASISAPALIVPLLATYIYTPYMPVISEYYIERKKDLLIRIIRRIAAAIVIIGALILLVGYFFGEWGLTVLFGESIKEHSYLLMPILLSVIFTAFVYFINAVIISMRKTPFLYISSVAAVAVCFAFSFLFVSGSINGASIDLIVIQLVQAVVMAAGCFIALRKLDKHE